MPCSYHNKLVVTPHKHRKKTRQPQHSSTHLILFFSKISKHPQSLNQFLSNRWKNGERAHAVQRCTSRWFNMNQCTTARHCLSQGLEDQPPRYPRGQMVKGFQTLVAFHQMGWRSDLSMPEPLTFHEDRQLKPEFQYHIKTHIKIDQNRIAMHCIIQKCSLLLSQCCCFAPLRCHWVPGPLPK